MIDELGGFTLLGNIVIVCMACFIIFPAGLWLSEWIKYRLKKKWNNKPENKGDN